jgi:adenylate cyclase
MHSPKVAIQIFILLAAQYKLCCLQNCCAIVCSCASLACVHFTAMTAQIDKGDKVTEDLTHETDLTVLVIDDSEMIQKSIERALTLEGIRTLRALSGKSGIQRARESNPHLILLDIHLGDANGVDVCNQLRRIPGLAQTPIIAISGSGDIDNHINVLEVGADDFLLKPFHPKVLLARVKTHIDRYVAQKKNEDLRIALQDYLSSPAVDQARDRRAVQKLQATILFSDMRGFTSASFDHDIEDLFNAMNYVLSFQADIVKSSGGYVDGFSGDGMLAVFSGKDAEFQAASAALEIRDAAHDLSVGIWSPIPVGIGLHAGEVMRGDIGSPNRKTFTVLGQAVNIAARLCGLARARDIVVSAELADKLKQKFQLSAATQVSIKGAPKDMDVFSLVAAID